MIEPGKPRDTAPSDLDAPPKLKLAILTCMDARINLWDLFHLGLGDAHVIRNAGAIATPDVIRSLAASQRLLETEEIVVIQHTDCGIHRIAPTEFAKQLLAQDVWSVPGKNEETPYWRQGPASTHKSATSTNRHGVPRSP